MPYYERLKDAFYTSPSGFEISFDFEELRRDISHRIGSFEFSGINGTLHQDKGISGEVYPLRMFIHGPDYDIQADKFIIMSKEIGPGFLNHPRYGKKRVQLLSVAQTENLAERSGQAIFDVEFQETLEREFPLTGVASQQQVSDFADDFQTSAIDNFTNQVNVENLVDELSHEQSIILSANIVDEALASITSIDQEIAATFRSYIDNILNKAGDYVQEPFEYATQITSAIRVISEIPGRISAKLNGFKNLLTVLKLKDVQNAITQTKNSLLVDELVGTMAIVVASESVNSGLNETSTISRDSKGRATITVPDVDSGFQTRSEVLSSIVYLQDHSNELINFLDTGQALFENNVLSDSYIQSVQSYAPMWKVVGTVIKAGLDISFSLPVKRIIKISRSRTILDLCYEFYKNIDDITLDYFILTNSLSGNEIIEVPAGKGVIIYE